MSRDGNLIFHEHCHPRGRCDRATTARRRRHVGTVANWGLAAHNILKCEAALMGVINKSKRQKFLDRKASTWIASAQQKYHYLDLLLFVQYLDMGVGIHKYLDLAKI